MGQGMKTQKEREQAVKREKTDRGHKDQQEQTDLKTTDRHTCRRGLGSGWQRAGSTVLKG